MVEHISTHRSLHIFTFVFIIDSNSRCRLDSIISTLSGHMTTGLLTETILNSVNFGDPLDAQNFFIVGTKYLLQMPLLMSSSICLQGDKNLQPYSVRIDNVLSTMVATLS